LATQKARCYDVEAGRLGWKLSLLIKISFELSEAQHSTAPCGQKQIKTDQQKRFNKWLK